MTNRFIGLTAALLVVASPVMAQGRGKGKGRGRVVIVQPHYKGVPPGLAGRPGRLPPGQYRKIYTPLQGAGVLRQVFVRRGYKVVRTSPYGRSHYVYYRLPNGTVRRAIVRPGSPRLGFTNVPDVVLQDVLSQLY